MTMLVIFWYGWDGSPVIDKKNTRSHHHYRHLSPPTTHALKKSTMHLYIHPGSVFWLCQPYSARCYGRPWGGIPTALSETSLRTQTTPLQDAATHSKRHAGIASPLFGFRCRLNPFPAEANASRALLLVMAYKGCEQDSPHSSWEAQDQKTQSSI